MMNFPIPIKDLPDTYRFDPLDVRWDPKLKCKVLDPGWHKKIMGRRERE